jgi:acyl-CoA thioester hydrolase
VSAPAPIFRRERAIAADDIDALGHVNNAVWVRFVVELATAHAHAVGFGGRTDRALGGQWIVSRHEIDYLRPALPGERVVEETWVELLRGARSTRRSRFTRASDGSLLVQAVTLWAWVDPHTLRPRRIPQEVLDGYPIHNEDPSRPG